VYWSLEFVESIAIQVGSGDEAEIMRCFGKSRPIIDISIFVLPDLLYFLQMFSGIYWLASIFLETTFLCDVEADGSSANTTAT
jgi:hypothetical protein